jgi:hypothetical protein
MRRNILFLALVFCALPARAQGILPRSFSGWNAASVKTVSPQEAQGIGPASVTILREYGTVVAEQAGYTRENGHLLVTLYRMKDPSGGYGLLTYLRTEDMQPAGISDSSAVSAKRALIRHGNLLLDASGNDVPALSQDLAALASAVSPRAETGPDPTLESHLPKQGLDANSRRYVLGPLALHEFFPLAEGDWAGFYGDAEAEVAQYNVQGHEVTLLLVDFPTPQAAEKQFNSYRRFFNINPTKPDDHNPALYARRDFTMIAMVLGAHSQKAAEAILGSARSGEQLTWNEPSFEVTQPTIIQIVVGAITGAGILCLYALVAGFAFAGVRLLVKRMLPGRVFDRANSTEILQLGLSGKPIESKDFFAGPGL